MHSTKHKTLAVMILIASIAGCSMIGGNNENPEIVAEQVTDVPEDATVYDSNNETIADVRQIQSVLEKASNSNRTAVIDISTTEKEDINDSTQELEYYEGPGGPPGWYIQYRGNVYAVYIQVKQQT